MLTGAGILDSAQSMLRDPSADLRTKMLSWLQVAFQQAFLEHDWHDLLVLDSAVTITDNKAPKASLTNYGRFFSAKQGDASDGFLLLESDRLTPDEVFTTEEETVATSRIPAGWHEDSTSIYFLPGATGTVDIKHFRTVSTPADDDTATEWPDYFLPLFQRTLITTYYEYDRDERLAVGVQLDVSELSRIKKWQNKRLAVPKRDSKGYMWGNR